MQKAMKFKPYINSHHHWYHLCLLFEKNKNNEKAIEALKNAITLAPENTQYISYLEKLKNEI